MGGDDRIRRVGFGFQDVEASIQGADGQPNIFPERGSDGPLEFHEVDAATAFDAPGHVLRKKQTKDVDVRDGVEAALSSRNQFRHAGIRGGVDFIVGVVGVPEVEVVGGHGVGRIGRCHALGAERHDQPVLERPHGAFNFALGLRGRRDAVGNPERAAHAPELGYDILPLGTELRNPSV